MAMETIPGIPLQGSNPIQTLQGLIMMKMNQDAKTKEREQQFKDQMKIMKEEQKFQEIVLNKQQRHENQLAQARNMNDLFKYFTGQQQQNIQFNKNYSLQRQTADRSHQLQQEKLAQDIAEFNKSYSLQRQTANRSHQLELSKLFQDFTESQFEMKKWPEYKKLQETIHGPKSLEPTTYERDLETTINKLKLNIPNLAQTFTNLRLNEYNSKWFKGLRGDSLKELANPATTETDLLASEMLTEAMIVDIISNKGKISDLEKYQDRDQLKGLWIAADELMKSLRNNQVKPINNSATIDPNSGVNNYLNNLNIR